MHSSSYRRATSCTGTPAISRAAATFARLVAVLTVAVLSIGVELAVADAPKKAAAQKVLDINFDHVKFEMKKGDPFERSMLTPAIKKLDGQNIRIRGYILPAFKATGLEQFVLVRDNMECCFGPGAALYDCILVEMLDGASTDYTVRPVSVEGTFTVKELKGLDGKHLAIYHLDGFAVKQP